MVAVLHGSRSTDLHQGFTKMKKTDIIDLSDEQHVKNSDFIYQYFYTVILHGDLSPGSTFYLQLYEEKWYAVMKIDGTLIDGQIRLISGPTN